MTDNAKPLGWGRFLLQFVTVMLAFLAGSVPAVAIWGMGSLGLAFSTVGSSLFGILAAWLWLRSDNAVAQGFNLARPPMGWPRAIAIGIAAAVAIQLWFQLAADLLTRFGAPKLDTALIMDHVTASPAGLALWVIAVAWFAAGFGEEMIWRGFLTDRLERLKGLAGNAWAIIAIQAFLFALPHAYQSWTGILVTGGVGLLLGWLRLKTATNLWPLIVAHALVDTISMTLGYASKHGLLPF